MLGLAVLFFLSIAFAVYCVLIYLPIRWAKKRGLSKRKRFYVGMVSFLVVSALFFGKNLISYSAFRYYCSHKAGLTVYKTLAQWQQENPGVWETLKQVNDFRDYQDREKYPDVALEQEFDGKIYTIAGGNQRIILYNNDKYILWGALDIASYILIDHQSQEILADYYGFYWKNTWDTEPSKYGGREGAGFLGRGVCTPNIHEFFEHARSFSNPSLKEKSDE